MNCENMKPVDACKFVVLTGGPGAGKTAVLELARKSLCGHVAILPEAASIVFGGGFPRRDTEPSRKAAQEVIFHVQRGLEKIALSERVAFIALCDRGTVDGLAYWPSDEDGFWKMANTAREKEFARYSAVIHLRSPMRSQGYNHDNPIRTETELQAQAVDARLAEAWKGHPNRFVIESSDDFVTKAMKAIEVIKSQLPECCRSHDWKVS